MSSISFFFKKKHISLSMSSSNTFLKNTYHQSYIFQQSKTTPQTQVIKIQLAFE